MLTALCSLLIYFAHDQFQIEMIKQQDPVAAIPIDAAIIIESDDIGLEIIGLKDGIANPFGPEVYAVSNYARKVPEIFDFGYIRAWVVKLSGSE